VDAVLKLEAIVAAGQSQISLVDKRGGLQRMAWLFASRVPAGPRMILDGFERPVACCAWSVAPASRMMDRGSAGA